MSAAPTQITTTRPAAARSGPANREAARAEAAPTDVRQDPPPADGRLREAALERPHTVANPRRVRVY